MPENPPPPFAADRSVPAAFHQPLAAYLAAAGPSLDGLATGALVFSPPPPSSSPSSSSAPSPTTTTTTTTRPPPPRILLLQRAPHDSMPLLWETPGGAADAADASVLAAAARELREETGLAAAVVRRVVGGDEGFAFRTRAGRRLRKVSFLVDVDVVAGADAPDVRIDPAEHVAFVWATEAECARGRAGDVDIPFTHANQAAVVSAGFRVWDELAREAEGGVIRAPGC